MRMFLVSWLWIYGNTYFSDAGVAGTPGFVAVALFASMPLAVIQDVLEIRRGILAS